MSMRTPVEASKALERTRLSRAVALALGLASATDPAQAALVSYNTTGNLSGFGRSADGSGRDTFAASTRAGYGTAGQPAYTGNLPVSWYTILNGTDSAVIQTADLPASVQMGGSAAGVPSLTAGAKAYQDAGTSSTPAATYTNWGHNADFGLFHLNAASNVTITVAADGNQLSPGFSVWQGWDTNAGSTRHQTWLNNGAPKLSVGASGVLGSSLGAFKGTAYTTTSGGSATLTLSNLPAGNYTLILGGYSDKTCTGDAGSTCSFVGGQGGTSAKYKVTFIATASNSPPTFTGGTSATLTVPKDGAAVDLKSSLAVTDTDSGQTLTWSQATAPSQGGALVLQSATATSNGGSIAPGGTLTYQPKAGFVGTETFAVQVSDGTATVIRSFTVTATEANIAPTFVGGTVSLAVAKDSAAVNLVPNLHASDPNSGQTLTWTQTTSPAHGTVAGLPATATSGGSDIVPGGTVTYTPATGFTGADSFTVQVSDGSAAASRTFTVTVGAATGSSASFSGSFTQDSTVQLFSFTADGSSTVKIRTGSYAQGGFDPLLTLFDAFGRQIGFIEPNGYLNDDGDNGGACSLVAADPNSKLCLDSLYQGVLPAGKYWLALTESNNFSATINLADGFNWDGKGNVSGLQFACSNQKFCDYAGNNRTGAWSLEITGAQAAKAEPLFLSGANQSPAFTTAGPVVLTIPVSNGAADLKRYLHVSDPDPGQTELWMTAQPPAHGTLVAAASAASGGTDIVPGGTLSYTPAPGYAGPDSFALQVSDGITGAVQTFAVTVTNANTAPKFIGGVTGLSILKNSAAVDLKPNLHVSDSDVTQTIIWSQGSAPAHGTLTLSSAIALAGSPDIVPGGTLTYTPAKDYVGTDSFTIQASDGIATVERRFAVVIDANLPPIADAGSDQIVSEGAAATLDGSRSRDPEGTALSYQWTQTEGPGVVLQPDAKAAKPQFTAPPVSADTVLTFNLVVTDSDPDRPKTSDAATAHVMVRKILPGVPSAHAGGDVAATGSELVTLDGSQSSDPDPGQSKTLKYQWSLLSSTPPGIGVALSDATAVKPAFTVPQADAKLTFQLVVTDIDGHASAPATVAVSVKKRNTAPEAHAAGVGGEWVRAGAVKTLDGSGSFDPDGDALTYAWTQTGGPKVVLSSTTAPKPTFTAPSSGAGQTLVFSLKVNDGRADSSPPALAIRVTDDNNPPVVNVITQPVLEGADVTLNSTAIDPDGDAVTGYLWQQVGGTPVVLTKVDGPSLRFTAPTIGAGSGSVSFSLTATDDYAPNPKSASDVAVVQVNNDPSRLDCAGAYPDRASLWPANRNMVPVRIFGIVGPRPYNLLITGVTSDEPVKYRAAKDATGPDARIKKGRAARAQPQAIDTLLLRAERQKKQANGTGSGNGRVYQANFQAYDGNQSCTGKIRVEVAVHAGQSAVDDRQKYNALKNR
jgi:hypothetical protein